MFITKIDIDAVTKHWHRLTGSDLHSMRASLRIQMEYSPVLKITLSLIFTRDSCIVDEKCSGIADNNNHQVFQIPVYLLLYSHFDEST